MDLEVEEENIAEEPAYTGPLSTGVAQWGVAEVVAFFEKCRFPTAGVVSGQIDGKTLLELSADADAEAIFTAAAPDGLGFNRLLFIGRFQTEMALLRGAQTRVIVIPRKAVVDREKRKAVAKEKRGRMPSIAEDREAIFEGMPRSCGAFRDFRV